MSRTLRNLVALSCVLMTGQALASDLDSRFYISPNVSATVADKNWETNNGMGMGIGLGTAVSDSWNLELNTSYTDQNFKNGNGNVKNTGYDADAMYFFTRNPDFSPFIEGGLGGVNSDNGSSQNNFAGNVGVGFMRWMNDIAIRADLRYRHINNVSSAINGMSFTPNDWILSAGLVIPLGAKPAAPLPPPEPAPAPAPVAEAPAPVAPAPVVAPTPVVDTARPAVHSKLVLEGSHFTINKASLRPSGKQKLNKNAADLKKYPDMNVEIVGYTDNIGTAKYNLKLSKKRAETVKKYLESKGIAADRMTTKGFGKEHPIATNQTAAGRAKNRRVEIEIMN